MHDRPSNFCCVPGCALDTLQSCRGIHINALSPLLKSPCISNTAKLPLLQAVGFMQSLPICLTYKKIRNKNKKILKKARKINQIHRKPSFLGHNMSWSYFLSPRLLKEYNFFICNVFFWHSFQLLDLSHWWQFLLLRESRKANLTLSLPVWFPSSDAHLHGG